MADKDEAADALLDGYARGVQRALSLDHPDLSWQVDVERRSGIRPESQRILDGIARRLLNEELEAADGDRDR